MHKGLVCSLAGGLEAGWVTWTQMEYLLSVEACNVVMRIVWLVLGVLRQHVIGMIAFTGRSLLDLVVGSVM
jgi:hypothetical protein